MAGISRSVTLTIAYHMRHFAMPMQAAYQYVKERKPAISPNLNFMGQLVEFENCEDEKECVTLKLAHYAPSAEQDELTELMKRRLSCGAGSSKESVDKKLESEVKDEHPVVNSVAKSLGGTEPTVLSQLRKGSVEQAIKSFEKLDS